MNVNGGKGLWHDGKMAHCTLIFQPQRDCDLQPKVGAQRQPWVTDYQIINRNAVVARAIIHNSDYQSVQECMTAIDRYFFERNQHFKDCPKRAGNKLWGKEIVPPTFDEANNCKDPRWRS